MPPFSLVVALLLSGGETRPSLVTFLDRSVDPRCSVTPTSRSLDGGRAGGARVVVVLVNDASGKAVDGRPMSLEGFPGSEDPKWGIRRYADVPTAFAPIEAGRGVLELGTQTFWRVFVSGASGTFDVASGNHCVEIRLDAAFRN